jgi:hypothetical protein
MDRGVKKFLGETINTEALDFIVVIIVYSSQTSPPATALPKVTNATLNPPQRKTPTISSTVLTIPPTNPSSKRTRNPSQHHHNAD